MGADMRRVTLTLLFTALASLVACSYGFYNGSGLPFPSVSYWGWQCADGSQYTDAGCPPTGPCADLSFPSTDDSGDCACADGYVLPMELCQTPGPCADGSYPSIGNMDGTCECADGTMIPDNYCEPPPPPQGADLSFPHERRQRKLRVRRRRHAAGSRLPDAGAVCRWDRSQSRARRDLVPAMTGRWCRARIAQCISDGG